ncbi:uncharacterized protein LOC121467393 [Drosophila elegans]|uniref:uncharacterized protein LOC121467393 n=1 Tax=Drosophila elegans TaxID=30023 RepID=UPI001BC82EDF|nr:uncharacterized protein LOC121467393 [Drosophila elegans]
MSECSENLRDQQDICHAIVGLANLEEEEDELVKVFQGFVEEIVLPPQLLKKSESLHAYGQSLWELDVPENTDAFFKESFRVEREHFNTLVEQLQGLKKKDTNFRDAIPLDKRIAIACTRWGRQRSTALWEDFLECRLPWRKWKSASGDSELMDSRNALEQLVSKVMDAELIDINLITIFEDGCHIEIRPAAAEAIDYYNYKGWYSTILFALVDYRYRFLYVNVGCPGRCHDSQVYECSALKSIVDNTDLFRANSKRINETDAPVVLLGDPAFT